ncbi:MAG: ABC transporter ATP-binding protein, partial [Clostridiales bacterium]|nr:ABC transporter ATP-binding protein [Clostridiales bacterium]
MNCLTVKNLSKSFGSNKAVDGISFTVPSGSFFAFLGQNGAGKSTTINMLIGLLQKDGGEIIYEGEKGVEDFKKEIGVVFQNNVFDDQLRVKENLELYAALYYPEKTKRKECYNEIIGLLDLKELEKRRFGHLSGGQKRKVEIARALLPSPKILFLDEPTTGLDPKTRKEVWAFLHGIKRKTGATLFLTTHYMEEAADADKIVIIHKGKKICEGSPSELKSQYSSDKLFIQPKSESNFVAALSKLYIPFDKSADNYIIAVESVEQSIDILNAVKDHIRFY